MLTGTRTTVVHDLLAHCLEQRHEGLEDLFIASGHDRRCCHTGPHVTLRRPERLLHEHPGFGCSRNFLFQSRLGGCHIDQDASRSCACEEPIFAEIDVAHLMGKAYHTHDDIGLLR